MCWPVCLTVHLSVMIKLESAETCVSLLPMCIDMEGGCQGGFDVLKYGQIRIVCSSREKYGHFHQNDSKIW